MLEGQKRCKGTHFFRKVLLYSEKSVTLHRNYVIVIVIVDVHVIFLLGLTGFDGEMKWYVSTRRLVGSLLNPSQRKFNWQQ